MSSQTKLEKPQAGQYLTFQLRSELFGMPIQDIREINQHGEVTPVPHSPESMKGVMNLRGKIIPVINLRIKFGMAEQDLTRDSCIIVVDTTIGQIGMIVDSVKEVLDLSENQIEFPPNLGNKESGTFVKGMGKVESKVIILVDVKTAFSFEHAFVSENTDEGLAKAS
ncbi:MAG: chemotaxis protein CheW [Pseudobdellovibrionaceae bacterium]